MLKRALNKLLSPTSTLPFEYTLKRSRRKSVCIQIKHSQVRVLAPMRAPKAEIVDFLLQKQHWIEAKLSLQKEKSQHLEKFKENPEYLCKGISKKLIIQRAAKFSLRQEPEQLVLFIPHRVSEPLLEAYIKKQLSSWYQQQAVEDFPQRLTRLSQQLNLQPTDLQIKKYKARWGSCNSRGVISLNYLLMMTPEHVIDYVVIHELCHLQHMNHSASFWDLVAKHCPDYPQAKQWLKLHSTQLHAFH